MDFVRIIGETRPRFFVMENVKGLMSAKLKDADGKDTDKLVLDIVLHEFKKLHYKTVYGILDAVNYGVPQFRERFVMIGSRDGEDIFLPMPTHFRIHQNPDYRWRTLGPVIGDLEQPPVSVRTLPRAVCVGSVWCQREATGRISPKSCSRKQWAAPTQRRGKGWFLPAA